MKSARILLAVICTALFSFGCSDPRDVDCVIEIRPATTRDELLDQWGESNFDSGVTYGVIAAVRFLEEGRYDASLAEINKRAKEMRDGKL